MRVFGGVMALVFGSFAAAQYNDPDPVVWMSVYGAAAAVGAWEAFGPARRWAPLALGGLAAAWAAWLVVRIGQVPGELGLGLGRGMISERVELTRELGGLLLVTAAMGVLAFRRRPSAPGAP